MGLELGQGTVLVDLHETAVSNHISGQNRGESAFQWFSPSGVRLSSTEQRIHAGWVQADWRVLAINRRSERAAQTSALPPKADASMGATG